MKRVVQFESKNAVAAVSYYDHNSAIVPRRTASDKVGDKGSNLKL
jgi:hypothetical protein